MPSNKRIMSAISKHANAIAADKGLDPIDPGSVIDRGDGVYLWAELGGTESELFFDNYCGGVDFIDNLFDLSQRVADELRDDGFFENETSVTAQWISNA